MITDIPTISNASYSNSTYGLGDLSTAVFNTGTAAAVPFAGLQQQFDTAAGMVPRHKVWPGLAAQKANRAKELLAEYPTDTEEEEVPMTDKRRLVQVFIVDPDENVPLDQALLYTGEQKLTDLTDQELFFEIDIKAILAEHNGKRTKIVNKKVKERTEHLEATRARDLRMVVVEVAKF